MAFLYLRHLDEVASAGDGAGQYGPPPFEGGGPDDGDVSDHRLRQFFRYSIETMTDDVYGDGYRGAAAAYADMGSSLRSLLEYVIANGDFPQ